MPQFAARLALPALTVVLVLLGCWKERNRLAEYDPRIEFTRTYLDRFADFLKQDSNAGDAYVWLTQHSAEMQDELGPYGYLGYFQRPFDSVRIQNAPVMITLLPELYSEFNNRRLGPNVAAVASYEQTIQEVLVRHIGVLEKWRGEVEVESRNPFVWLREGVRAVVASPLTLLVWLGLASTATAKRAATSAIVRVISGVVALVNLAAAVLTLILGWQPLLTWLARMSH